MKTARRQTTEGDAPPTEATAKTRPARTRDDANADAMKITHVYGDNTTVLVETISRLLRLPMASPAASPAEGAK